MILRKQKAIKTVALFLVFAIIQLYVSASSFGAKTYAQDTASLAPQNTGILSTTGNKDILADKNEVNTGATILQGMTLETPACVSATVRWGLDEVSLATNTIAIVNRSDGKIKVILTQGCARVRVEPGVEATIETPDGKVVTATQLDSSNRKYAEVCVGSASDHYFDPSCGGGIPLIAWVLGGIGVPVAVALIASNLRGDNPSDSTP